ncbi:MAG: HDOD domain-containing protein [Candidatus Margulisbacteria bacterium]|nr:HDOD domain-containing protein [Candidatus Margulisiibacteriota bacterium]
MDKDSRRIYDKLVLKAGDLLPLPITIHELIKITNNPNVSSRDIGKVIEKDQAMTSRVLRLANSVYYGFTQRIRTISHAIVCLGFSKVKSLALTVSTYEILNAALEKYAMKEGALFNHSIAVAIGASTIAEKTGIKDTEEAYVIGLLHDIGKMVIDQNLHKDEVTPVWELYKQGTMKFHQAEKEVLGFDHADVGSEVARRWNFPNELCNAIGYHHSPLSAPGDIRTAYIVNLADGLAKTMIDCKGMSEEQDVSLEIEGIFKEKNLEKLGLVKEKVLDIRNIIAQKVEKVLAEFKN